MCKLYFSIRRLKLYLNFMLNLINWSRRNCYQSREHQMWCVCNYEFENNHIVVFDTAYFVELLTSNRKFYLHLQCRMSLFCSERSTLGVSAASKQKTCLLSLFFDLINIFSTFLRNVSKLLDCTTQTISHEFTRILAKPKKNNNLYSSSTQRLITKKTLL